MAKKFVDAGLIEQQSVGHCSISAPSRCTTDWMQGYFTKGVVPPHPVGDLDDGKWVRCKPDQWPWHYGQAGSDAGGEEESAQIETHKHALRKVQEELARSKVWGSHDLDWVPRLHDLLAIQNSREHCSHRKETL
jgi:hypothetical protein